MNSSLQLRELLIAYALAAAGMLAALLLTRADRRAFWRWPVYSAMALASGVILWNLMRKHLFPPEWLVANSGALYYAALLLYLLLGFGTGLLLGRITAPRRDAE
jgi:hypothetical protein